MEKPERKGMCELIGCTSIDLVKSIHKLTFDRQDIENIRQMVTDKHFSEEILPGFQAYIRPHLYKVSEAGAITAVLPIITRGLDDKILELLAARKEDAVMQASRTAEDKENAAKEIARTLAEMDEIENTPMGKYLKKLADRADKAEKENKYLKGQASLRRPGTGPIKKGTSPPKKTVTLPSETKGLKNQRTGAKKTTAPLKTSLKTSLKPTKTNGKKRGNPNQGGRGKRKISKK